MPATIQFKNAFFAQGRPVETSVSVGSDGLITGSVVFVLLGVALKTSLQVGSPISPVLFSGLQGINTQGMFIETHNLEKRNGLFYLRLGVVGAVNPPIVLLKTNTSPRGFSKSQNEFIFSFDYQAQTLTASAVTTVGSAFSLPQLFPRPINTWNITGQGTISRQGTSGKYAAPIDFAAAGGLFQRARSSIVARPRILITESFEVRAGIVNTTKTAQFVYE